MVGLEAWKLERVHIVYGDVKFGSLEIYTFCVMMISLEVWKFTCCV